MDLSFLGNNSAKFFLDWIHLWKKKKLGSLNHIYTKIWSKVCDFFRETESDCRKTAFSRAFFLLCICEPKTLHWKARSERKTRPLQTLDLPFLVPCQLCRKSHTVQSSVYFYHFLIVPIMTQKVKSKFWSWLWISATYLIK